MISAFRRSLSLALAAALGVAMIPAPSQAAGNKFATVDMARVLREYDEVKRAAAFLQSKKDEFQEQIDKKQQEIRQVNDEIDGAKTGKGKAEVDKLEKKKQTKIRALQNDFQRLKEKLGEIEKEEFDRVKDKIYAEIDRLVQARGIEMVFEKQWLYYPRQSMDITDDLLKTLGSSAGGTTAPRKKPSNPSSAGSPAPAGDYEE